MNFTDFRSQKYFRPLVFNQKLVAGNPVDPTWFPSLFTLSPALSLRWIYRPLERRTPEFVYVPFQFSHDVASITAQDQFIHRWGLAWESGHLRHHMFHDRPRDLACLSKYRESNLYLLPDFKPRYEAYAPLFHLLPADIIERFSLPVYLNAPWPFGLAFNAWYLDSLKKDFEERLSQAFAHHIWPLLNKRSPLSAFSKNDPLIILSHNLDFWLPYTYQVIEDRVRRFPRCDFENPGDSDTLMKLRRRIPAGTAIEVDRPLKGGDIWAGEADAWKAAQELIEAADHHGKLRAIIDAVLSNRIQDDFSSCWSHEREDFERKFFHKRSKVKVAFVELEDTLPVHGPESEIMQDLLWEDFITLLDPRERRIVVCLRKGFTRVGEISQELGYANHSPVSKALKRIREKARRYFEN